MSRQPVPYRSGDGSARRSAARLAIRVATVALSLLLMPGCTRNNRPNLIIVLVDTLRPDHLGCYGYERHTSPQIDALADSSALFLKHYSHASRTGPAVASIFTGLHPRSHGVVNPLTYFDAKGTLSEEQITLAEILSTHGYECYGFSANFNVAPQFGFGQGFDTYEFVNPKTATAINRAAFEKLKATPEPFFLYLHYMEPHSPYAAPFPYRLLYADPKYSGPITGSHQQLDEIVAGRLSVSAEDVAHLQALYDQEIRYFDDQFGKVLEFLEDQGLREKTVIVFVADHGEEFLEHGSVLHGYSLYEDQLMVPFFIHDPRIKVARHIDAVTRHIDILPTLLTLMDIRYDGPVQGRNLVPLLRGQEDTATAVPVFAQASLLAVKTIKKQSLMADGWKLIETQVPQFREELYHLAVDPNEQQDLISEKREIAAKMRKQMRKFVESLPKGRGGMVPLTAEDKERLRSLGYLK